MFLDLIFFGLKSQHILDLVSKNKNYSLKKSTQIHIKI